MSFFKKMLLLFGLLSVGVNLYGNGDGLLHDAACQDYMYKMASLQKQSILLATDKDYPYIMTDNENIKIDKKKKIISVWLTFLVSKEARRDNSAQRQELLYIATHLVNDRGIDDPDFAQNLVDKNLPFQAPKISFDYSQSYIIIDYANNKYKDLTTANYLCSGQIVQNFPQQQQEWKYILPNTLMDTINNEIIKKYKLK